MYRTLADNDEVAVNVDGVRNIIAFARAALMSMARSAAPATVNGRLRLLRQVFDDAVADGVAGKNLARAVKSLPEGRAVGMA